MTGEFTIVGWRSAHAETSAADFCRAFPHIFLVSAPWLGDRTPKPEEAGFRFQTRMEAGPVDGSSNSVHTPEETVIYPVRKQEGNPFRDRISIGRALNCDVVVQDPSVSKLHGHFTEVAVDSAIYTDDGSSNGTVIGNRRIDPGKATPVHETQRIVLGRVRFRLMSSQGVYELLRGD